MTFTTTEIRVLTPRYVYLVKNNPGTVYDASILFEYGWKTELQPLPLGMSLTYQINQEYVSCP